MSVIRMIERQLERQQKLRAAVPAGSRGPSHGLDEIISVLKLAHARIEHLAKVIDERLPTEAEIALQLLPAVISADPHLDWERQSQEAFQLAETFLTVKDQRK